jgi:hypothetical protein
MHKIKGRYLVLAALPLYVACAASEDSEAPEGGNTSGSGTLAGSTGVIAGSSSVAGTPGTGGTPGTAGTPSTGGTPGTAGTPSTGGTPGAAGTLATAGTGTGGAPAGACPAPTSMVPLISDFAMANASNQLSSGTDVWSASPAGAMATAMGGALHITSAAGAWASASTLLNKGATCFSVDGKYTGIKFKISSPTNKTMKFIVVTPETKADSSHYHKILTLTTTPTDTPVLFSELAKSTYGAGMMLPADYKPSQHIIGLGFGVMEMAELMDITIDDVTFY